MKEQHFKKPMAKAALLASALMLSACDDLTERSEDVRVTLDTFTLIGGGANAQVRASTSGNPSCSTGATSMRQQLARADNYDEIDEYLESVDINNLTYRVIQNGTPVDITASFQMTDNDTGNLAPVASVIIPAGSVSETFTTLPFSENGATIVQHYMDNLDSSFSYCAQGSPDVSELNIQLDLQLDMEVTVDIL